MQAIALAANAVSTVSEPSIVWIGLFLALVAVATLTVRLVVQRQRSASDTDPTEVAELRRQVSTLTAVLRGVGGGICVVSREGQIILANLYAVEQLGWTEEELLGKTIREILRGLPGASGASPVAPHLLLEPIGPGGAVASAEDLFARRDGSWFPAVYTAQPLSVGGQIVGHVITFHDITADRQREEALRASERHFREIVTTVSDWIWQVDAEGRYTYSSPSVERTLGYSAEEIVGMHLLEPIQAEDGPELSGFLCEAFRAKRAFQNLPKHARRKDGHGVWLEMSAIPLIDEVGELIGYRGIDRDITERHLREEQIRRAERFVVSRRLAGQVAHDLNNLIAPLVGYPELIGMQLPTGHSAARLCDAMLQAALQLADVNEGLQGMARCGQPGDEPVNLNRIVDDLPEQLANRPETLKLELRLGEDLLPVGGSAAQLSRVVRNLVLNAREAMKDIGVLTVTTDNVYVDEPIGHFNRVEVGEYVRLTVRDTGPGIPAAIRDTIFDPFFTTKQDGAQPRTGLGLSLVQAVVDDHRGCVDVESVAGKGTAFRVYLPVNRDALRERYNEGLPGGNETILIVDDDVEQVELMKQLLQTLGYRVQIGVNGEEGIAYLKTQEVDLVILDMVMPSGIDGAETYQRMLEIRPSQRAIIVSGYAELERVGVAQSLGAGAYLRKPVTLGKLARAVRRELDLVR